MKNHAKKYAIDMGIICLISLIISVALLYLAFSFRDIVDEWASDMNNQLIIIWSTVGLLSIFGVSRAVKYVKK